MNVQAALLHKMKIDGLNCQDLKKYKRQVHMTGALYSMLQSHLMPLCEENIEI